MESSGGGNEGLRKLDPEDVNLDKYPLFATLPYKVILLEPGDCVYIPSG